MLVKLLTYTPEPDKLVAAAAKLCYSDAHIETIMDGLTPEKTDAFLKKLSSMGHQSPTEHAYFTFGIEGVSRTLLAQITRHRIASFSVQSQRYAAAKMTDKDYKQSVSDYMKMKSPDRQKAPAPNLNSQTGRNQVKSALESSNNKKIANAAKNGEVTNAYTDANGVIHASLQTKDKNGRVNGMYDVAVSGNGKDVMAQVASSREVTTDANGNKLIKDDKLGTFAYNKETGTFEQVKDKDGNVPENPLSVQVPDKVNKNNVEEVADWATKTDGFDKAVQEKEATDNYFNATDAERLNMDSGDVNQDQMNNMARHEINGTFEREGANGEKQLAIGEDDMMFCGENRIFKSQRWTSISVGRTRTRSSVPTNHGKKKLMRMS